MDTVYRYFDEYPDNYHCCLLVLTDGKHRDSYVRHIRGIASTFNRRNWPVTITTEKNANKKFFFIASLTGEFDISLLEQFSIRDWINKNRIPVPAPQLPQEQNEPAIVQPSYAEPVRLPIVITPPADDNRPIPSVNEPAKQKTEQPNKVRLLPSKQKAKIKIPKYCGIAVLCILGAAAMVILAYAIGRNIKDSMPEKTDGTSDDEPPSNVNAEYEGKVYDLGQTNSINNLIIGTGPASIIPISDEGIEPEHIRFFTGKKRLWIKNTSSKPIDVNGAPLGAGKKEQLLLPARISLSEKVKIDVFESHIDKQQTINQGDEHEK